jgi:diacylglycerol O-acyltransferase / wax synthase
VVPHSLQDGRLAVLFKVHHAMADGLAALAIIASLFDLEPDAADPLPAAWSPAPLAPPWALRADNLRGRLVSFGSTVAHPICLARSVASTVRESKRFYSLRNAAPQSSVHVLVGVGRRLRVVHLDLEGARAVAHEHGAKVNDVVLSVVAGGVCELLAARGEQTERVEMVASVTATLRSEQTARELGTAAGGFTVPLPTAERNPVRRLELIAASTRAAKAQQRPASVEGLMAWLTWAGLSRRFIERQRMINFIVTNIPGPPMPLFALGARIEDVMPIVGPGGNVTMVFAALSYCGRLNLLVDADATACPDVDVLADGMRRTWEELVPRSE